MKLMKQRLIKFLVKIKNKEINRGRYEQY